MLAFWFHARKTSFKEKLTKTQDKRSHSIVTIFVAQTNKIKVEPRYCETYRVQILSSNHLLRLSNKGWSLVWGNLFSSNSRSVPKPQCCLSDISRLPHHPSPLLWLQIGPCRNNLTGVIRADAVEKYNWQKLRNTTDTENGHFQLIPPLWLSNGQQQRNLIC